MRRSRRRRPGRHRRRDRGRRRRPKRSSSAPARPTITGPGGEPRGRISTGRPAIATLLFLCTGVEADRWRRGFAEHLPDLDFVESPDDPGSIDYALVWLPPAGALAALPNLKCVFSLGAGVDRLFAETDLPPGVPVVRLVDPALTELMVEYVVHWVCHLHRGFGDYLDDQPNVRWERRWPGQTGDIRVGVLGLGELGGASARALARLGFDVAGWSRTAKSMEHVTCLDGPDGLGEMLARSDILVNLLPLTPETRDLLDAAALARLPRGASLINCARGDHLVEADLLAALDSGHLSRAVLDVFREEPLPAAHPFRAHPRVTITPHVASLTNVRSATAAITANILRIEQGRTPHDLADPTRGY